VTHVALACRSCSNDVNQAMDPGSCSSISLLLLAFNASAPRYSINPKRHHAHTLSLGQQNDAIAANTVHATAPGIGLTPDGRLSQQHEHQLYLAEH